jgi:hypothetical protein
MAMGDIRDVVNPPKVTLRTFGVVITAHPCLLKVRETVNGHPLDGGILRFAIPSLPSAMAHGSVVSGRARGRASFTVAISSNCSTST